MAYLVLACALPCLYLLRLYYGYRKAVHANRDPPGLCVVFDPTSVIANLLPVIPGVTIGRNAAFNWKHGVFHKIGWDTMALRCIWPSPMVKYYVADAASIKEITSSRAKYPKPSQDYSVLMLFGNNIVSAEGLDWKRYRKCAAPAFSDRNNKLVWDETVRVVLEMSQYLWQDKPEVVVDHCLDITLTIALLVIGVAGFGHSLSWKDEQRPPPGHALTFKHALHKVSKSVLTRIILPRWALGLTQELRDVRLAFDELERYMLEMIQLRKKAKEREERYDLFSGLLEANQDEGEGTQLSDRELFGNIFIFLLAGHETTAHTLCYVFGLLALHQEEQQHLYQHIKSVFPEDRLPTYDDMPTFTYSMAVFNETLRLFPPVTIIPKISAEPTVLTATNSAGESKTLFVPGGTKISINTPGLHYNPRYWDDPHAFKPSRFLGNWPRDAFLPFSSGARACLGRRFAETESVAAITMMVLRYKIRVKEDPQFAGETFEERKNRVLASDAGLTLTPLRVPLVFERR